MGKSHGCSRVLIVSGSDGGSIRLWDVSDRSQVQLLADMPSRETIYSIAFSPDGTKIVAGKSSSISVYKYSSEMSLVELVTISKAHAGGRINSVAFSKTDSSIVVSGSSDGDIKLWKITDGSEPTVSPSPSEMPVTMSPCLVAGNECQNHGDCCVSLKCKGKPK